jgi:RNA polymerase sigma factor (sigma-70 family)
MSPADIEELYVGHARRIAGYVMRATGDAEVAADITAETFAAALLARERYRPDMGAPTTWLYAIAANKLKDWRRRGYAEDRARRRLRIERPPLSETDLAEFGRLADEVTADALALGGGQTDEPPMAAGPKPAPVGTVIPKGEGTPPRERRSTVVATGTTRGIGPWQLEATRSTRLADPDSGELYQPEGLRCLSFYPLDPDDQYLGASSQCGEFPRTPGFGRLQSGSMRPHSGSKPVLVYGRVPRRATAVRILVPGRSPISARLHVGPKSSSSNFYSVAVKPPLPGARVNWFDANGKPGSRGIALMPPIKR